MGHQGAAALVHVESIVAPEWITLADVGRREVDPVIYVLLADLTREGWRLRRQGHKFYAFCPCGDPGGQDPDRRNPSQPDRARPPSPARGSPLPEQTRPRQVTERVVST